MAGPVAPGAAGRSSPTNATAITGIVTTLSPNPRTEIVDTIAAPPLTGRLSPGS
ncbi:hypothetical protein COUCH_22370 [Couchioplanes caeruleus]|uniref:hypothetical protein n=1 Tax=Couchioplanes caeruleus TaxID=56438 RepID=UPI0020BE2E09|nr:hypothetical protein [Couchioplanes caeruleus]UQU61786.1 hypothetical protein COUCH_22370 [Couchioplanes caeruleus]